MAKFKVSYKSRPVYPGENKSVFYELMDTIAYCEFSDDAVLGNSFVLSMHSDSKRFTENYDYSSNGQSETQLAAAGHTSIRHSIQMIPEEGFLGTFFQIGFEKVAPTDGHFDYFGCRMSVLPRQGLGPEFMVGGDSIENGWE